jgi:ribosomal protein S27E
LEQNLNEGKIIIVCHNCGTILYKYTIGDKNDKNKFNGPPIPKKALSGYDRFTCPVCGATLSLTPKQIKFISLSLYKKMYSENNYKLVDLTKTGMVENNVNINNLSDRVEEAD